MLGLSRSAMKKPLIVVAFVVVSILGMTRRASAGAPDCIVTTSGASAYVINGQPNNPGITLTRGHVYIFELSSLVASNHPIAIQTGQGIGNGNLGKNEGVTFPDGLHMQFAVPGSAASTLYYQCQVHDVMTGVITIVGTPVPATTDVTRGVLGFGLALLGAALLC